MAPVRPLQLVPAPPSPGVTHTDGTVPGANSGDPAPSEKERDFETIFQTHFWYVWRTLRRLGVREADREDLANEVFFQVHRRLPAVDLGRPLRPWLFAFAFRIASSHRRLARHRYECAGDGREVPDSGPRADETLERRDAQRLVDRALDALSLEQRAVFVLHEIDGFTMPEIASALAVPLPTAYSRLRLAREHFIAMVQRLTKLERRP